MHRVPRVNLADPTVEPTDDELRALMTAVRDTVVARGREARVKFLLALESAIHGPEVDLPPRDEHAG